MQPANTLPPSVVASPIASAADTECNEDPRDDFLKRHPNLPMSGVREEVLADLDGDAQPEILLAVAEDCGTNCGYAIYLSGGGCSKYAGEIFANAVSAGEETRNGVRDIVTWERAGCGGLAGGWTVYGLSEAGFEAMRQVVCPCPSDSPRGPRDPSCPEVPNGEPIAFCGQQLPATETAIQCSRPADLEPLSRFANLTHLALDTAPVDPEQLRELTRLRSLFLSSSGIRDLSALGNLTELRTLDLSHNPITDIAPLSTLSQLVDLALRETEITNLAPLAALTRLEKLDVSGTPVNSLAPLASLHRLRKVVVDLDRLDATQLRTFLRSKPRLEVVAPVQEIDNLTDADLEEGVF